VLSLVLREVLLRPGGLRTVRPSLLHPGRLQIIADAFPQKGRVARESSPFTMNPAACSHVEQAAGISWQVESGGLTRHSLGDYTRVFVFLTVFC